ncbi:MAG TPA: cytochrome c [Verrucomicrobiae bacterium]|nr:cytochrome c [Verrucomicrobiae bacterium]
MKKILVLAIAMASLTAWTASGADGKAMYDEQCAKCHGKEGKGDTKMGQKLGAKDYSTAKAQGEFTDEAGVKAIRDGLKDKDGKVLMKPSEVTEADAKAMIAYMRTLKK